MAPRAFLGTRLLVTGLIFRFVVAERRVVLLVAAKLAKPKPLKWLKPQVSIGNRRCIRRRRRRTIMIIMKIEINSNNKIIRRRRIKITIVIIIIITQLYLTIKN